MFSGDDVRRVMASLGWSDDVPSSLLVRRSSAGLVRASHAKDVLRKLVMNEPGEDVLGRQSISQAARQLDLTEKAVRALLPRDRGQQRSWMYDGDVILTRLEYRALLTALYSRLRHGPISLVAFSNDHDISLQAARTLARESNDAIQENGTERQRSYMTRSCSGPEEFIYTFDYASRLTGEVATALESATTPTIIRSSSFGGAPPRQLLEQIACEVVSDERNSIDGVVDQTADDLRYTPRSYTDHRIDELFSDLQSGHRDYLPYETLTRLDPSIQSPRQYLRDRLDGRAILLKHGAVPVVYVGRAADSLRRDLVQHGYIALDPPTQASSAEDELAMRTIITQEVSKGFPPDELQGAPSFLFRRQIRESLRLQVIDEARRQALQAWADGRKGQYHAAHPSDYLEGGSKEKSDFLRHLLHGGILDEATLTFRAELDRLETRSVHDFAEYWMDKVDLKLRLHRIGLGTIVHERLRQELTAALDDYAIGSVVPEHLRRAEARGLIRADVVRRSIQTLTKSLHLDLARSGSEPASRDVDSVLRSFRARLPVVEPDDALIGAKKRRLVEEMTANMRLTNDGPRLFLALVIIIMARDRPGLIYATGRFAPRLLKQVGAAVDADRFADLDRFKMAAKAGEVTSDIKDRMVAMAISHSSPPPP